MQLYNESQYRAAIRIYIAIYSYIYIYIANRLELGESSLRRLNIDDTPFVLCRFIGTMRLFCGSCEISSYPCRQNEQLNKLYQCLNITK